MTEVLQDANRRRLEELASRLAEWNERINLVSRKSVHELLPRHVLPCYVAGAVMQLRPGMRVADVGCGGGLPGLPLAIRFPDVSFTLIDSVGKKLAAVEAIAADLGLANIRCVHARAESVRETFSVVTGRAVADFHRFLGWTRHLVDPRASEGGFYYFKGGEYAAELAELGITRWQSWLLRDLANDPGMEDKAIIFLPAPTVVRK